MPLHSPPRTACWQHLGSRSGFEVVYFTPHSPDLRIEGTSTGVQEGDAWVVTYDLTLDHAWHTRNAWITTRTTEGSTKRLLASDGNGHWLVDGAEASNLDGCLDIDLEASALTNAFPVHRLGLRVGEDATAPAAYVRLAGATIERLEQRYARIEDQDGCHRYNYEAPAFSVSCQLAFDRAGLVLDYPDLATRIA